MRTGFFTSALNPLSTNGEGTSKAIVSCFAPPRHVWGVRSGKTIRNTVLDSSASRVFSGAS